VRVGDPFDVPISNGISLEAGSVSPTSKPPTADSHSLLRVREGREVDGSPFLASLNEGCGC
jgi:hypothetical protein